MSEKRCPFCFPDANCIFHSGPLVLGLWDAFPVNPGHALLVPKRHVATWFDATDEEKAELISAVNVARKEILARHQPDGFNIGVNIDEAAGQTVFHLHLHVIPRYRGDVEDPTGGVRNVVPERGNYLVPRPDQPDRVAESEPLLFTVEPVPPPHRGPLIRGESDPLLPHLLAHLGRAIRADLVVSFVLRSGVDLLYHHLRELLDRKGRLRLLTSDYLGITEPDALVRLLDLEEESSTNVELRVFRSRDRHFHPKAYIFHGPFGVLGNGVAYVGSSNLSGPALKEGIEWNYRVFAEQSGPGRSVAEKNGFKTVVKAFEELFQHPMTTRLDQGWIDDYRKSRPKVTVPIPVAVTPETPPPPPEPHTVQKEALEALEKTRVEGNQAGLVVLATGLGKTWLAAFDTEHFDAKRVLFVAHREEILRQSRDTFRRIRPAASLGFYTGQEKAPEAEVIFASIQTLSRINHLRRFEPDAFDYIVIDEFHHAAARSYRKLIEYFEPRFLLGLTATPERSDGGNLLALCGENLVYRCDLVDGIKRGLLSPFHYFRLRRDFGGQVGGQVGEGGSRGEATVSTRKHSTPPSPPSNGHKTPSSNTKPARVNEPSPFVAPSVMPMELVRRSLPTSPRLRRTKWRRRMADYFKSRNIRAAAVHTGEGTAPRARSLEKLRDSELVVIFAVDIFNEGVDLPNIDTIMMLRPTESRILWTQQFGRGLRKAEGKTHLTVIDYIGNHRTFLLKPQTLLNLEPGDQNIAYALDQLAEGNWEMPPGCEVTYELEAVDILKALLRIPKEDVIRAWYKDFRDRHGERPSAVEAFHEGFTPGGVRKSHGSWLRFVDTMGDLPPEAKRFLNDPTLGGFLDHLEVTAMTKSFKMVTLQAMLQADRFPGEMSIEELTQGFARIARRSAKIRPEVEADLDDTKALRKYLEKNPIHFWAAGEYFSYQDGGFRTSFDVPSEQKPLFQDLVREIVDWRLASYLERVVKGQDKDAIVCKVSHAGGRPILFLPDRKTYPGIPTGWTTVLVDGELYEANFVKVAVNVMRKKGEKQNRLADVLRAWFGSKTGLPGTNRHVAFRRQKGKWILEPLKKE